MFRLEDCFDDIVILAGLPRCGTSWLGEILDTDPYVLYKFEPFLFEECWLFKGLPIAIDTDSNKEDNLKAKNILTNGIKKMVYINDKWLDRKKRHVYLEKNYNIPKKVLHFIDFLPQTLREDLFEKIVASKHIKLVIKTPRSTFRLKWFNDVLKNLKIIYIIRHPCGYVNSLKKGKKYDMGVESIEISSYMWLMHNETVFSLRKDIKYFKLVIYEELCKEPLKVVKEIFNFLNWQLSENTKSFVKETTSAEAQDPGYYSIYKNPLENAYKWKNELTKEEVNKINSIVGKSDIMKLWCE